ncbi:MAG: hypothetical protein E7299_08105 [Lachnospiraceae bacterium]|nr:hypothetical protein [Lachnospiraceae bacterium]
MRRCKNEKKVAKVITFKYTENSFQMSQDVKVRMSFHDRLKFLIYGEKCILRVSNGDIYNNSFCEYQYCETSFTGWPYFLTSCGYKHEGILSGKPYCPICGKRIKVVGIKEE